MDFENEEARLLFLSYAFTSIDKDHIIPEDYRGFVLKDIKHNEHIEDIEDFFTTGLINCLKLSRMKGKEKIDEETINRYFLGGHNKISDCKAYEGIVIKVNKRTAKIKTNEGTNTYRTILEPNIEVGNNVIVHGKYVIGERK
jgi:hypothetical protein